MCFYFAILVNLYGIGFIIHGNNCHSITFHVFIGSLPLLTQPIVCTLLTTNAGAPQHFVFFIHDHRCVQSQLRSCSNNQSVGQVYDAMEYANRYIEIILALSILHSC